MSGASQGAADVWRCGGWHHRHTVARGDLCLPSGLGPTPAGRARHQDSTHSGICCVSTGNHVVVDTPRSVAYRWPVSRQRAKKIRVSEIRNLSRLQVSEREAAAFFGIKLKTFQEMLRIDVAAAEAWESGRQLGKISIRRKQFRLADTSAPM